MRKIRVPPLRPGDMKKPAHMQNARPGRPDRALPDRKVERPYLERDEVPSKTSPLVFIGGIAACGRIGIGVIRVVIGLLLKRHVLFGLLRPGEAVAAAAQQQSTGNQNGGEKGREGGMRRTVHGSTGLIYRVVGMKFAA